jgi:hypothetical protein
MKMLKIISTLLIMLILAGCGKSTIGGNGNVTVETRKLNKFNCISIKGAYDVELVRSDSTYLRIEADDNLLPVIITTINDSILEIYNEKNIIRSKELKLIIACPDLQSIDFSGATELTCDTTLDFKHLNILISGAGRIDLTVNAQSIKTSVSGGAELVFKGIVKNMEISITGTGNLNASKLFVDSCAIDISGFGWAKLNVKQNLEVNISGFGKVEYSGNPEIKQSITGGAKVKHVEDGQL